MAVIGITTAMPASATIIDWAAWSSPLVSATSGSANGVAGGVNISYSGELESFEANYPSYGPSGTFNGGTIDNAPPQANGIIRIFGGGDQAIINTITFSQAVTNPVFAIWSLGQGGINASFNFNATPTFESGGPSSEYAGQPISVLGNVVSGLEGNGTVQFTGTFNSLSWTNPTFENWYGFTVGVAAVPEPETYAMMLAGLGLMGFVARRRRSEQI
jgi:hypothetical protein